ncbi:MAG: fibronectin type III domain-containing protein [Syntrophobacteraceae bacterium]
MSATAGNAQATVSFTAPASNGGSAITGYSVTSKPAGGVDLDAGTTSAAHTVDGLTNGKAYTFTVTAANAIGIGPASSPSNKVTPAAKNAKKPTVTVLEPKQNASVPGDTVVVQGTASDKSGVASVWWCVNGGPWQQASGTAKLTANVPLVPGVNTVDVYSEDPVGNVSAIASLSLVSLENLVDSYWPMNDGDEKNYTGVMEPMTMSFAATGSQSFDLTINPVDTSGDSGDIFYELDASDDLLLTGEDYLQYTLDFEPPLLELDATLLASVRPETSILLNYLTKWRFLNCIFVDFLAFCWR